MDRVVEELVAALPEGAVVSDPDVVEGYRFDRASTVTPGRPRAVVRATCTADVQAVLRIASQHRVPVVPRGAGTGLSGGAAAVDGAITLSTDRMRAVDVDPAAMVAVVQPGALNAEVKAAAAEHGLWYPPDPSSYEICSIGGNLATNAGGLCCVRQGVTTDYVLGIEVVLADGRAVRLGGRTIKDVAGYDLKRLFVGSEGTLGVITEATLRLRPAPPPLATIVATFDDVVDAGRAVTAIMGQLRPATLELMDAAAVAAVEAVKPMGLAAVGALLLAQCDVGSADVAAVVAACESAGAAYVAATEDADEGELLLGARRMAIPCVERLGAVLIEDVGVPIPRIPDLVAAVEQVAARTQTRIPVIGHAGDGNFHPLVTFDPADADAAARAQVAFDEVMRAALALGGTITGEHGVGSLKAAHLHDQLGPDVLDLSRRVKAALDPDGILNPGKWI
ncbi:FAD-binding oxidoreductase [Actinomarinicola tropica]|uniref:FAD-binding protein n=1 Tax=Actinomarinicola tropica TaxID=2789776 RepID=A0A5Q2REY0_9ACTN|nr:FAD-linked oxidase C-terminal domain-containing protein [Actinomarinicola tropica]QGG94233.1 FAD-binding protein [Actinomarinicola tropica]